MPLFPTVLSTPLPSGEVFFLAQHFGLERLQPRGQRCATFPYLLGANQPEGWFPREPLGIVGILVAGNPAVDGLAQSVRQRELGIVAAP